MPRAQEASRVYVLLDAMNERTPQLVCGPYRSPVLSVEDDGPTVRAVDDDLAVITVCVQDGDGWRAHPSIKKRSPRYAAVWFRSTDEPPYRPEDLPARRKQKGQ